MKEPPVKLELDVLKASVPNGARAKKPPLCVPPPAKSSVPEEAKTVEALFEGARIGIVPAPPLLLMKPFGALLNAVPVPSVVMEPSLWKSKLPRSEEHTSELQSPYVI